MKYWITLNEPWIIAWLGYGVGTHAPGQGDAPGVKPYQVAHILLKSHARAYHIYRDEFKSSQNGIILFVQYINIAVCTHTHPSHY